MACNMNHNYVVMLASQLQVEKWQENDKKNDSWTHLIIVVNCLSWIHHTKDLIHTHWTVWIWHIKLLLAFINRWNKIMPRLVALTIISGFVESKLTRAVIFTKFNHHLVHIVILESKSPLVRKNSKYSMINVGVLCCKLKFLIKHKTEPGS